MSRLASMDKALALEELVDIAQLARVLESISDALGVSVGIRSVEGALLCQRGEIGAQKVSRSIEFLGDVVAHLELQGPKEQDLGSAVSHSLAMVLLLVETAFETRTTKTMQQQTLIDSFHELADRNVRLSSATERLQELERLKSNFLATISHELRTPLTSIIGYSEMLAEGLAGPIAGEQKEFVETILTKAEHLLQLISGILDVSLIESRSVRLDLRPLDSRTLVEGVAKSMERDLVRRSINLEIEDVHVPRVMGDSGKLKQVVLHLLANAIKFSPEGGVVKVSFEVGPLSPEDRSSADSPIWRGETSNRFGVRIRVRDKGIGIPDDKRSAIFEPFFQIDSGSTRAFGGTGLGLSLAKNYVVAHGGFLWLDDRRHFVGSEFVFSLPAVDKELEEFVAKTPN